MGIVLPDSWTKQIVEGENPLLTQIKRNPKSKICHNCDFKNKDCSNKYKILTISGGYVQKCTKKDY